MKEHGLDLADLSIGFNTDEMATVPFADLAFMVERGTRLRRGLPGRARCAEETLRVGEGNGERATS